MERCFSWDDLVEIAMESVESSDSVSVELD
jgi:hypothetical protein